jgi:aspartate/methionine/tyrosine aminotransferase
MIYVCNPNNPTGSVTRKEDIDDLIASKPKGCIVLVDEAYIHFATSAVSAVEHVAAGKDVIVLRSFSKLYGMAGLRAGAALARPDLGVAKQLPTELVLTHSGRFGDAFGHAGCKCRRMDSSKVSLARERV